MAIYKAFIIKHFFQNYLSILIYVCISVLILCISILIYYNKSSLFNEHHLNKYFLSRVFFCMNHLNINITIFHPTGHNGAPDQ